jgi:hypothetical protein
MQAAQAHMLAGLGLDAQRVTGRHGAGIIPAQNRGKSYFCFF